MRSRGRPRDLWPRDRAQDRTRTPATPLVAARGWRTRAGRQSRSSSGRHLVGEIPGRIDSQRAVGNPSPTVAPDLVGATGIEDLRQLDGFRMARELHEHLALVEA